MEEDLKKISKTLMLHADNVDDLGLLYGKMGLIVFYFHYARYSGNQMYEDFAMELVDSLQEKLFRCRSIDYGYGLAGIGTVIEYLVQNGYIEADTNETLEDFDIKIANLTALSNRTDGSLFTGITGSGRYFLFRIAGVNAQDDHIPTLNCKMELIHITDILDRMYPALKNQNIYDVLQFLFAMEQTNLYPVKTKRLIDQFLSERIEEDSVLNKVKDDSSEHNNVNITTREILMNKHINNIETIFQNKYKEYPSDNYDGIVGHQRKDKCTLNPGLYGGLSGIGLYLMSKLDKRHETWMKLL